MNPTPPNVNSTVNVSNKTALKLFRNIFLIMTALNGVFFLLFGMFFSFGSIGTLTYTGETQGTVTGVNQSVSDGTTYCTFIYEYSVKNKHYSGVSSVGTPSSCAYSKGSTVAVKFDPDRPTSSTADDALPAYFGLAFVAVGVVSFIVVIGGIALSIYMSKREDRNNDGLPNDAMPATAAQLNMIQNGMKDLGEFWMPPRKMTQQEAREAISSIQLKLAEQGKTLDPSS